ncbi:MAG: hypothetical protein V4628_14630, partial [Pseudomonadota bacterium]
RVSSKSNNLDSRLRGNDEQINNWIPSQRSQRTGFKSRGNDELIRVDLILKRAGDREADFVRYRFHPNLQFKHPLINSNYVIPAVVRACPREGGDGYPAKSTMWIPAFAGMTKKKQQS